MISADTIQKVHQIENKNTFDDQTDRQAHRQRGAKYKCNFCLLPLQ